MRSEPDSKKQNLMRKIQQLERENEALRLRLRKTGRRPSRLASYSILALGTCLLALSTVYSHIIAALIGLALAFWGCVLLYITPTSFVKSNLLNSTAISSLSAVSQMIDELGYAGKGVYIPPLYLGGVKGGTIFIPSNQEIIIPPAEELAEEKIFVKNPNGICLPPPGLALVNLYEDQLGKDLAKTDLDYLQQNLPKVLIEDLQIAEDFEMETQGNIITATITGSIYQDLCKRIRRTSPRACSSTGCPLCSSIALATARASGKPVTIEDVKPSADNKKVEINLRLLEGARPEKKAEVAKATYPYPNPVGAGLFFTGAALLIWVGWIIWNDIIVWSKNLSQILFESRIGEAVSLGIGMNVSHHLLISIAVLISGLVILLLRRGKG